jgi:hypothetical protein
MAGIDWDRIIGIKIKNDKDDTSKVLIEGLEIGLLQQIEIRLDQLVKVAQQLNETIDRLTIEKIESDKVLTALLNKMFEQARPEIIQPAEKK